MHFAGNCPQNLKGERKKENTTAENLHKAAGGQDSE